MRPARHARREFHAMVKLRAMCIRQDPMKFTVSWSIEQDKWLPILDKWSSMTDKDRANVGKGVKMIGRAGQVDRCRPRCLNEGSRHPPTVVHHLGVVAGRMLIDGAESTSCACEWTSPVPARIGDHATAPAVSGDH